MSLTLRKVKGSALTHTEVDNNFEFLHIDYGDNILFVSTNGDDSTAVKGRKTLTWATLTQAAQAAVSGDVIVVMAGTYTITDSEIAAVGTALDATLFKDGVTWYFEPNAILVNGASETNPYRPFHCVTNGEVCTVLGYMEYVGQDESINETYDGSFTPFLILANDVTFHFEVKDIDTGKHGGGLGNVVGDNINITVKCKGTWTHRAGTGWYNGGEGETNNMSAILDFNKIISIEDPDYGIDGYGTPIFYPTGTDSRISITVKDCYATETDGVASSQAREGQFLSTQYLTRSQLTIKCNNYKNDYSVAVNDAIIWLRTVDCDISIHFDSCIADKLYYGVISLYNQNSTAETQPSRIKITGSYVGLDKPCITDLGHYGSAAIRNDDQVKVHAHLRSENSEVVRMDRAATDFELSGEIRCDWDDIAGHGIVLDAVGANIRLRDLEIVCVNASAKAIESNVGAITLLAYNTFSHTNPLSSDITLTAPAGFEFPLGATSGGYLTTGSSDSDVQDVNGSLKLTGDIIAENYIISSSILYQTQSFSSGSTIFGDSTDDTHLFTGSLDLTGSLNIEGPITLINSPVNDEFEIDSNGKPLFLSYVTSSLIVALDPAISLTNESQLLKNGNLLFDSSTLGVTLARTIDINLPAFSGTKSGSTFTIYHKPHSSTSANITLQITAPKNTNLSYLSSITCLDGLDVTKQLFNGTNSGNVLSIATNSTNYFQLTVTFLNNSWHVSGYLEENQSAITKSTSP
jgi:hypothetical protein